MGRDGGRGDRIVNKTSISYLDYTWNPLAMLCTPVSDGCTNCWHRAMAKRLAANPKIPAEEREAYAGGAPVLRERELKAPLRLKKPAVIGVQFTGDLFHRDMNWTDIAYVFDIMMKAPRHTFVVLTKRAERMYNFVRAYTESIQGTLCICTQGRTVRVSDG